MKENFLLKVTLMELKPMRVLLQVRSFTNVPGTLNVCVKRLYDADLWPVDLNSEGD